MMTVVINRVSYTVRDEKEAKAKAKEMNAASYVIKDGIVERIVTRR